MRTETYDKMAKKAEHKRAEAGRVMDRVQGGAHSMTATTYQKLNARYLGLLDEADALETEAHDAYYGMQGAR